MLLKLESAYSAHYILEARTVHEVCVMRMLVRSSVSFYVPQCSHKKRSLWTQVRHSRVRVPDMAGMLWVRFVCVCHRRTTKHSCLSFWEPSVVCCGMVQASRIDVSRGMYVVYQKESVLSSWATLGSISGGLRNTLGRWAARLRRALPFA